MRPRSTPLIFLLAALLVPSLLLAEAPAASMSVDDVVAKNLEARGGLDAWKAVDAVKIDGSMEFGPEMSAPFTIHFKRPDKVRMTFEMNGMEMKQGYDGVSGWQTVPALGKVDVQDLEGPQLEAVKRQADFEGPLVDWRDKGHTVEYGGLEEVDGTQAHRLDVTLNGGEEIDIFLDADTFLEMRQVGEAETPMGPMTMTIRYDDYKTVGDVKLAHQISMLAEGAPAGQTVRFESVEILDADAAPDSLFERPATSRAGAVSDDGAGADDGAGGR